VLALLPVATFTMEQEAHRLGGLHSVTNASIEAVHWPHCIPSPEPI
jgi:hypothetical protein